MNIWNGACSADVAARWAATYCNRVGIWDNAGLLGTDRAAIHRAIMAAGDNRAAIDAAVGNNSWTTFHCTECNTYQVLGAEFDNWDGGTVVVCAACLRKVVHELEVVKI